MEFSICGSKVARLFISACIKFSIFSLACSYDALFALNHSRLLFSLRAFRKSNVDAAIFIIVTLIKIKTPMVRLLKVHQNDPVVHRDQVEYSPNLRSEERRVG